MMVIDIAHSKALVHLFFAIWKSSQLFYFIAC